MMNAKSMASAIKNSGINSCKNATAALQKFWKAVCDYVKENAEVTYSWTAALTVEPWTPDATIIIKCKINTKGSLFPCNLTEANAALSAMSAQMNTQAALWNITPIDSTFKISPMFVIPSITLTASQITNPDSALEFTCQQIINGIKMATPATTGSHIIGPATYAGGGAFTSII